MWANRDVNSTCMYTCMYRIKEGKNILTMQKVNKMSAQVCARLFQKSLQQCKWKCLYSPVNQFVMIVL